MGGALFVNTEQIALTISGDAFYCAIVASNNEGIIAGVIGPSVLQANTKYFVKIIFDNTTHDYKILYSTDKETWNVERTVNSNLYLKSSNNNYTIGLYTPNGSYPYDGTIYMDEAYIKVNDVITWQGISYN